ncbi:MAG: c-type cytochrome [Gammaproteobacteria bacterium]|nr:c-type cytochrome [Gammaproteobacteria bacterium]MBU1447319.1 c-type cytochrome [Gammaproteobacteria bacterium]
MRIAILLLLVASSAFAADEKTFTPPAERDMPKNEFGDAVRLGKSIFTDTQHYAKKYVGNGLNCSNCHLDSGRMADSAPLWGAYVRYPAYRAKTKQVNTFEERLQGCFEYSMNGTAPKSGTPEMTALVSYAYWMSTGAPVNTKLKGAGFPKLNKPALAPDFARGQKVFTDNCQICHGSNGEGIKVEGKFVFPPLWGKESFNWGAGLHRIDTAAGFIKGNMPLGKGGTLSDQESWDVATYVMSHDRPADPRAKSGVAAAKKDFHEENCKYGETVEGHLLGE